MPFFHKNPKLNKNNFGPQYKTSKSVLRLVLDLHGDSINAFKNLVLRGTEKITKAKLFLKKKWLMAYFPLTLFWVIIYFFN